MGSMNLLSEGNNCICVIDLQLGNYNEDSILKDNINKALDLNWNMRIRTNFINNENGPLYLINEYREFLNNSTECKEVKLNHVFDYTINKSKYSCFTESFIYNVLHKNNITELYLCGLDIDACILATAFQLLDYSIKPIFILDLCDTSSKNRKMKDYSLNIIKRNFSKSSIILLSELESKLNK